jgi:ethanolamine utilization protein EutN
MFVGKVVGQLWTSKHVPAFEGAKLLLVLPLQRSNVGPDPKAPREDLVVVADKNVGAGVGEHVVVAYGRAARVCLGNDQDLPFEAAVAGIVDELDIDKALGALDPVVPADLLRRKES